MKDVVKMKRSPTEVTFRNHLSNRKVYQADFLAVGGSNIETALKKIINIIGGQTAKMKSSKMRNIS